MLLGWLEIILSMHLSAGGRLLFANVSVEMAFSSTNFDTCWTKIVWFFSWVICNEGAFLMICWSVPCSDTLPAVRNLKSLQIFIKMGKPWRGGLELLLNYS